MGGVNAGQQQHGQRRRQTTAHLQVLKHHCLSSSSVTNLMPAEAARLARDLGWDTLIPGHNDLFPNNAIPQGDIVQALAAINPRQKLRQLQPGELLYYVK